MRFSQKSYVIPMSDASYQLPIAWCTNHLSFALTSTPNTCSMFGNCKNAWTQRRPQPDPKSTSERAVSPLRCWRSRTRVTPVKRISPAITKSSQLANLSHESTTLRLRLTRLVNDWIILHCLPNIRLAPIRAANSRSKQFETNGEY